MVMWGNVVEAARELGIAAHGRKAEGLVDGCHVVVEVSLMDQQTGLFVRGLLAPPLDLGLHMDRRQVVIPGLHSAETGREDLDSEYAVRSDLPRRTRHLFGDALCDHLIALNRTPYDFRLDDGGCLLFQPYGMGVDGPWIVRAAHVAAETVALLDAARARLPVAPRLRDLEAPLRALAVARGLAFSSAPLAVAGQLDGRPIELRSSRLGPRDHHLLVRASFEAELGLSLVVRRERLVDGLRTLLGGQDVLVGDEVFDRRFLIQADPAEAHRVAAILDHDVRAALLELDGRAGPVIVDDAGVSVDPIAVSVAPKTVLWALDALDEVRVRIEKNRLHGGEGGPYR